MKLATRLSLAATAVIILTSLGISYTALNAAEHSEISRIDAQLESVVVASKAMSGDVLSAVSKAAEQSGIGLTVAFVNFDGDVTLINESTIKLTMPPNSVAMTSALKQGVSVEGAENYRMRTLEFSESEYVVIATTLESVIENKLQNTRRFMGFTFAGSVLGAGVVWWLIGRDTRVINRLIRQANQIAEGEQTIEFATARGSSEVAELTDSLKRMLERLHENQLRMEVFLGDSSHELRTPLTVIKGYVELLQHDIDEEQRQRAFARLDSEIFRMEQLIRDLLLLLEIEGATPSVDAEIDFSHLVHGAAHDMSELESSRKVTAEVADDVTLMGDERLLNQLVANLFGNIRRHTPKDAAVHIVLKKSEASVDFVVEDGGPGLSEDAYSSGIQHFQRFDKSRSRDTGGSGLGMSIITAVVQRHRGTITLSQSELGGLKTSMRFPLHGSLRKSL